MILEDNTLLKRLKIKKAVTINVTAFLFKTIGAI